MKKSMLWVLFCIFINVSYASTPAGLWKTIDDDTHKPKGIVKLTINPDHSLTGTILNFIPRPGYTTNEVCEKCQGARHNQPILGMVFLENLHQDKDNPNKWVNGSILDPKSGKVYRCHLTLMKDGKKIKVRGYLGIPLFGRTQEWFRTEDTKL